MRRIRVVTFVCAIATPVTVFAEPEDTLPFGRSVSVRVGDGELLPWMTSAHHEQAGVLVMGLAGRDMSTDTTVLMSTVEATIVDRVGVHASFANDGYHPELRPSAGISVDALRQASQGVDLTVGADYAQHGYNMVPAVVGHVALARHVGATTLLANLELGVGVEEGERYGAAGLGVVHALARQWSVGVASQAHLDLERDNDEPAAERDYDLQAGPVVTYAVGPCAFTALAGVSAWQFRLAADSHVGAVALLGVAALF